MAYPRTIRDFNVFVDGVSYLGRASEATLPQVKIQTKAHRGAGMDAPVGLDMGMEAMTADITFEEWDPVLIKKLGRIERFVYRPAAQAVGGEVDTIIATVGGLITSPETGALKPGEGSTLKLSMDVRYYRLEINGEELLEIDIEAGKRVIGGNDQLADIRAAMGV